MDQQLDRQTSSPSADDKVDMASSTSSQYSQRMAKSDAPPLRQNTVAFVMLHGVRIVSLIIDGKERLCLAQISNTLLKNFSYNEIHNRRVALGITCVQCTPVQLEILRRAGAMPISSRRCGMITKREAERLVKSFLEENRPPRLPDNFNFDVFHECGWGCRGSFSPSRYNSSRAKCIKCAYCNMFFSPNKFIFHCHRTPNSKYVHPDAANFNSWRRHLKLTNKGKTDDLEFAWEDVKAMFNGGSRKRILPSPSRSVQNDRPEKRQRFAPSSSPSTDLAKLSYPYPMLSAPPTYPTFSPTTAMMPIRAPHPAFPFSPAVAGTSYHPETRPDDTSVPEYMKDKYTPFFSHYNMFWAKSMGLNPAMMEHYLNFFKAGERPVPASFQEMYQQLEQRKRGQDATHFPKFFQNTSDDPAEAFPHTNARDHFSAFKPVAKDVSNDCFTTSSTDQLDSRSRRFSADDKKEIEDDEDFTMEEGKTEINVTDLDGEDSTRVPTPDEDGIVEYPNMSEDESDNGAISDECSKEPPILRMEMAAREVEAKEDENRNLEAKANECGKIASTPVVVDHSEMNMKIKEMTREELQKELLRMAEARRLAEEEYKKITETFQEQINKQMCSTDV